jgi:hypothetical protein
MQQKVGVQMSASTSPKARLSVAAAIFGATCAVVGMISMPIATADDDLTCSDGLVPFQGTCVPADNASAPMDAQQQQGPFDPPPSSLDDPSLFTPPYQITEGEVAAPGYNGGGGDHR